MSSKVKLTAIALSAFVAGYVANGLETEIALDGRNSVTTPVIGFTDGGSPIIEPNIKNVITFSSSPVPLPYE